MIPITRETIQLLDQSDKMIFIYTPFCGTCHLARKILEEIEVASKGNVTFYELNAGLFPEVMQQKRIESVPCLLITTNDEPSKIYSFESLGELNSLLHSNR
ncbi:thioredoxin family protein [Paraliobacillus sediminis]|uniref:thioredoxin family protein n=1 Tax=Paraliobacillus sediminis TaxID=1885916 RepID=UPI000E3D62AE|nr:thioredoxin family protein [Paraliobacillus sediminis]